MATKVERGGRIFPVSDNAKDVLNAFIRKLGTLKIDVRTCFKVENILIDNNKVIKLNTNPRPNISLNSLAEMI